MARLSNIPTLVACVLVSATFQPVFAQHIPQDSLHVYVQSDTLRLDATIASLFSKRAIDAIESGMTTSIAVQFRLRTGRGDHVGQRGLSARLEHDIWEGQYRLIRQFARADTQTTSHFADIQRACSELQGLALAVLPLPDVPLTLQVRIDVNPISPEQQERTRQWLRILEKGSYLEFFYSLDKPTSSEWIDLIKFRPGALPHLLLETQP